MKGMVAWFARTPVAANLLMVSLILGGAWSLSTIKMELFPEFSLETIRVQVPYPGAAPQEVEEGVCIKIEEAIEGIEGIDEVSSTAVEGMGSVRVEVRSGQDPRRVLDDVKTRVDAIETFPEEAEEPVIEELLMRQQVINVAVYGDAGERALKRVAERVRDDLVALPGISQVELAATRPYEISVEVSEEALRRLGLTFDEVAEAVRSSSIDLSGGSIRSLGGEILLRTKGQAYVGTEFEELVLRTAPDGTRVLLGDVATVVDGFEETDQEATFNGHPVAMVQVYRVGDESALEVAASVRDYVEGTRAELPAGIQAATWQDGSVWLEGRLGLLLKNGLQGLSLVFLVLALFLRFRLSFWVTLGIPISFLATILVMPSMGVSINMMSLFAFILVLGIVVDDAIVVGESVSREHESGAGGSAGAVRGVQRVAVPVVFAVLTTIAAFAPMLALPGLMGKFFREMPLVVIPALAFSLVESQLILPAHLSHGAGWVDRVAAVWPFRWWSRLQQGFARRFERFADGVYQPLLERALLLRYLTVALTVSSLILTVGVIGGGLIKFEFFPDIEGDVVAVQVRMPEGTSARVTRRAVRRLEESAARLVEEMEETGGETPRVIRSFMATVGEQPYLAQQQRGRGTGTAQTAPHLGEVVIELVSAEERDVLGSEIVRRWRELTGPIPGAAEVSYNASLMSAGDPIHVQLSGTDIGRLRAASGELKQVLRAYNGVFDVTDSFRGGKEEAWLDIRPEAQAHGLHRRDLARQVRQGFHGEEAQRIQRGRDDVKVMVRYPEGTRRTRHGLETMRLRTADGAEVPFGTVADVATRRGFATIQRTDRRRTISVTADVDRTVANANEILADLQAGALPELLERHPGLQWELEGQNKEQVETIEAMLRLYPLALFAVYALMAIPFRSYLQPLIVMTAIPFGVVGAVIGHVLVGHVLSILSFLGIAALAGVVVNDSLVLVDFVNRRRAEGMKASEAARVAGRQRFRPILLTSLTTFVGLTPLILERSVQAQFLVPMAISLAFGVLFSTLITLFFVPASYLILEDLIALPRRLYGTPAGESAGETGGPKLETA